MLSAALLLFANTLLFSLRLSGGGSFPGAVKVYAQISLQIS